MFRLKICALTLALPIVLAAQSTTPSVISNIDLSKPFVLGDCERGRGHLRFRRNFLLGSRTLPICPFFPRTVCGGSGRPFVRIIHELRGRRRLRQISCAVGGNFGLRTKTTEWL